MMPTPDAAGELARAEAVPTPRRDHHSSGHVIVSVGAKATAVRGLSIGDDVVIGANAVVARDIPANTVAAGGPAEVIWSLNAEAGIAAQAGSAG
jgi:serine acetyltransferase